MKDCKLTFDFDKIVGEVLPLHGVNCAPYVAKSGADQKKIEQYFTQMSIPYSRLHDVMGAYGGSYYVDIPNIFRNFSADETKKENYDFYYTDEYITAIRKTGANIVYRLGVTIEWGSKKYAANPPEDNAKWARICEHIVRHYNEGWADGFHYDIPYWEIWNEPENPPMWTGTKEQFFDLYATTAKHLKSCFPNIKVGGYGSCGFYTETRNIDKPLFKTFVPYFRDFLAFCRDGSIPLDFFSWHIYTNDAKEVLAHSKFARLTLHEYGFTKTESHLNEWNYGGEGSEYKDKHTLKGASFLAEVLIRLSIERTVDAAMYYVFQNNTMYNGFLDQNDSSESVTINVFQAYGDLFRLKNQILAKADDDDILVVASANGNIGKAMLINVSGEDVRISCKHMKSQRLLCSDGFILNQLELFILQDKQIAFIDIEK